jgi:hypothetical protein
MKPNIPSVLVPLILLLTVGSCGDNPVFIEGVDGFYPLAVGNTWKFAQSPWLFVGQPDSTFTEYVVGDTVVNSRKFSRLKSTLAHATDQLLSRSEDGLVILRPGQAVPELLYKFPGKIGDSYAILAGLDTITIVGTAETVTSPLGTFTCMVYQRKYRFLEGNYLYINTYVRSGVGRILDESFNYDSLSVKHVGARAYLVDYTLK